MNNINKIFSAIMLLVVSLAILGCETSADIKVREQQQRQDFIAWVSQRYQYGMGIFQEIDFSNPDKEKADIASTAFFAGTDMNMEFKDRKDCSIAISSSCPNAQELYYVAECLKLIGERGSIEKGLTIKDSMLRYYVELILENYSGALKEKALRRVYQNMLGPFSVCRRFCFWCRTT
ncbi:MAG: hypothetical protein J6M33_09230 [Anaerovibrio sp.]|nr:hypothetical protein [Anaerovibrio sp.]